MNSSITKKYNIEKTPFISLGFMNLWEVYRAFDKETSNKVCVFILNKKTLKEKFTKSSFRRDVLFTLKSDPINLYKLQSKVNDTRNLIFQNCNYLLKILFPFTEEKNEYFYVTEFFTTNLDRLMHNEYLAKLEIKIISKQLIDIVNYLHCNLNIVHNSLNLHSILITENKQLKICNFSLCQQEGDIKNNILYKSDLSIFQMNSLFNYMSPEIILDKKCFFRSDVFSIGCIIFAMLKIYLNDKNKYFLINSKNVDKYKEFLKNDYSFYLKKINFDQDINELLSKMLCKNTQNRYNTTQILTTFKNNKFINDPKIKVYYFIKNIHYNKIKTNYRLLLKLPNYLYLFENKIIEQSILPSLLNEINSIIKEKNIKNFKNLTINTSSLINTNSKSNINNINYNRTNSNNNISTNNLLNALIICVFAINDLPTTKIKFEQKIWPVMLNIIKTNINILSMSCLNFIIKKMERIGNKLCQKEFENNFIILINKCLDWNNSKLQLNLCDNLKYIISKLSKEVFNKEIYWRIINILKNSSDDYIKIKILKSLQYFYDYIEIEEINNSFLLTLCNLNINNYNSELCAQIINCLITIKDKVHLNEILSYVIPKINIVISYSKLSRKNFDLCYNCLSSYIEKIKEIKYSEYSCNNYKEEEEKNINSINENEVNNILGKNEDLNNLINNDSFDDEFKDFFTDPNVTLKNNTTVFDFENMVNDNEMDIYFNEDIDSIANKNTLNIVNNDMKSGINKLLDKEDINFQKSSDKPENIIHEIDTNEKHLIDDPGKQLFKEPEKNNENEKNSPSNDMNCEEKIDNKESDIIISDIKIDKEKEEKEDSPKDDGEDVIEYMNCEEDVDKDDNTGISNIKTDPNIFFNDKIKEKINNSFDDIEDLGGINTNFQNQMHDYGLNKEDEDNNRDSIEDCEQDK